MRRDRTASRRRFLLGAVSAGAVGLAGCVGGGQSSTATETETTPEPVPEGLKLNGRVLRAIFPARLEYTDTGEKAIEMHWHDENSHWHRMPLELSTGQWKSYRFIAVAQDGTEIPFGDSEPYQLSVKRGKETPAGFVETDVTGQILSMRGGSAGKGTLFIAVRHEGEQSWLSPPIDVVVE